MKCDYTRENILQILKTQLSFFVLDKYEFNLIKEIYDKTIERTEYCFNASNNKYYLKSADVILGLKNRIF